MLKYILAAALVVASVPAHSQSWLRIADSSDGIRLSVDVSTLKVDTYPKQNAVGWRVSATMLYSGERTLPPFIAVIDADDCMQRGGGVLVNILSDADTTTYVWDSNGTKMYDAQGQFLCGWLLKKIEMNRQEKQQNNTNNKPAI